MPDKPELFDWDDTDFCPADASHDVLYMGIRKYVAADTIEAEVVRLTAERDALRKEWLEADRALHQRTLQAAAAEAERDALLAACNQARLAFAGHVSSQSAINMLDALNLDAK